MDLQRPHAIDNARPLLAWAGWWMPLPDDWRLIQVMGSYRRGNLTMGDPDGPRLEANWAWVTRRRFDAMRYAPRFLLAGLPWRKRKAAAKQIQTLTLPGFSTVSSLRLESKTLAVGYVEQTHRILHWVYYHGDTSADTAFYNHSLPAWRDQPLDRPAWWRFFDISFASPPGFSLKYGTLNLGDMEVLLVDPSRWRACNRLCVRHLYPADLALSRQTVHDWLKALFLKRRGPYRKSWRKPTAELSAAASIHAGAMLEGRLQLLMRTVFRPLLFRLPGRVEASLIHLKHIDKLLYMQIAAPASDLNRIRSCVLESLPRKDSMPDASQNFMPPLESIRHAQN